MAERIEESHSQHQPPTQPSSERHHRNRPQPVSGTANIYYRPRRGEQLPIEPTLPTPHIRPRQRRPQSIHVITYPPGYVPTELRKLCCPNSDGRSKRGKKKKPKSEQDPTGVAANLENSRSQQPPTPHSRALTRGVFGKVLGPLKSHFSQPSAPNAPSASGSSANPGIAAATTTAAPRPQPRANRQSVPSIATLRPEPPSGLRSRARPHSMIAVPSHNQGGVPNMVDTARRSPMLGGSLHTRSASARSAKAMMSSAVNELPKPVASGSGVSCSIILAEPNIFLTGFEHDGHPRHDSANSTALLRGKLQLNVSKNAKLKSVTLKLSGKARTEWPEGIPPMKVDQYEEESLRTQVLTFFHAMHETWETEYGNQCTYTLKNGPDSLTHGQYLSPTKSAQSLAMVGMAGSSLAMRSRSASSGSTLTPNDYRRLSLQSAQSRSFGKGDSPNAAAQNKGYKVFYPGTYEYSFELPIDHHQLETTKLQFGSVKWELETIVERTGAFKPNLHGSKEVSIVRVPDQLSLEMTEPISISRQWEDQLHYDIMISGKSFPIGTKIPIAFKLTPLAKVQVHKLKVFVTESVEYWTNDRRVTRKDPGRKVLLMEKAAGKPLDRNFEASEMRTVRGGELSPRERHEARAAAARRRSQEASMSHAAPDPLPDATDNILGDLDLGLESYWGSTEIEMNVQIPTCEQMAKDKSVRLHPDCSWKNVNVYHWIKIVMRISRQDPEDPTGKRRRHFEISIDSPFTVLNCRATQANTALPEYTGADQPMYRQQARCGCPDAEILSTTPSPASSNSAIPAAEPTSVNDSEGTGLGLGLAPPPAALVQQHPAAGAQPVQRPAGSHAHNHSSSHEAEPSHPPGHRPIHLLRYPSFNPPPFEEDEPPPPMPVATPPPQYDTVIGTPSVDGLADYFARLADYDDGDSSDEEAMTPNRLVERSGRLNVPNPRTPGGRLVNSRSLEMQRTPTTMELSMADSSLQQRRG